MSGSTAETVGHLTLESPDAGYRIRAEVDGIPIAIDSGADQQHATPVQLLIAALAGCVAMDVIGILRKKRLQVTDYRVEFRGERASEHPRRFTSIAIAHRLTGRGIPAAAVAEALRLSEEKYCSVRHTLRTDLAVSSTFEVVETA